MRLLSSLLRSSSVSVVFDFNASLNDFAPLSPMLLTVDVKGKGKSELLMVVFCVSFLLLSSQLSSSSVSVMLVFNASLIDNAPVSQIQFSFYTKRTEKNDLLMNVSCVLSFFCHYLSD